MSDDINIFDVLDDIQNFYDIENLRYKIMRLYEEIENFKLQEKSVEERIKEGQLDKIDKRSKEFSCGGIDSPKNIIDSLDKIKYLILSKNYELYSLDTKYVELRKRQNGFANEQNG